MEIYDTHDTCVVYFFSRSTVQKLHVEQNMFLSNMQTMNYTLNRAHFQGVSECCLTPTQQFFSNSMARTS